MTDFLHCLAAVWCFELGGLFTWAAKECEDVNRMIWCWFAGSVFMALGWWLA